MQKTKILLDKFSLSLKTLEDAILESQKKENKEKFEYFRDSVIQRFEYTAEIAWKTLKLALEEIEWIECNSPKSCFKDWFSNWYISNLKIYYSIIESRNSTSHNYEEWNSTVLYDNILTYIKYLKELYEQISAKSNW